MKLSINSRLLIAINTIHSIIDLFISTFLVAYFLNITNNNIVPASLFYIFTYFISMIGFPLIGPLVKSSKKKCLYNCSFIINSILLLFVIHLKENVISYIWILGIIYGLEKICYWFPQNVLTSKIARGSQVIKFNGYKSGFSGVVKIIMPIFFGWLITIDSFIGSAVFVLFLTILEFVLSSFIRLPIRVEKPFNIIKLVSVAFRNAKIKISLYTEMIKGFVSNTLEILIVLYVVYLFKSNFNLGVFTSVFAVSTVVSNMMLGKYCKFKNLSRLLFVCSLLTVVSIIYFVFDTDKLSFIVYNFIFASAWQVINTITEINMYKVSQNRLVASDYRDEYLALREFFLCFGRILGFGLLLLIASLQNFEIIKYLILFYGTFLILIGYLSIRLCRQLK